MSDVLVKVGRLIFPTDFMILYVNEDAEVLIILRLTISFHFLCSLGRPMQEVIKHFEMKKTSLSSRK